MPQNDESQEKQSKDTSTDSVPTAESSSSAAWMIGDYRIIRKIGAGGMGIVYEAEQQHPKRLVALKVIQGGRYVDEHQIRLFEREAQALARLKHPGIASIYESGRTSDGQHFFAMELVRGEALKEYLERTSETGRLQPGQLKERLILFRKICEAVTYAHQRGVVHRDLKPSNVFVQREVLAEDSDSQMTVPGIKILDFGLARITETDLAVATVESEVGRIQGTLPYMSPEQVRGNPDEIDVRTDVYSLGVILYEMVSGRRPYDINQAMLHEAVRVICESPPVPLSKSWSGMKRLDHDIETIVVKALEKQPGRRYQSVSAFGEDVVRFLAGQPILARPPSALYQMKKMVVRHKVGFGFAAALVILVVAFGVLMSIQAHRIARERDRANREATASQQVTDFLVGLFKVSDPSEARGNSVTAREILDRGALKIRLDLKDQPLVQARLMRTIGRVYDSLGLYDQALSLQDSALAQRQRLLGEQHLDVAESLSGLGTVRTHKGDYEGARLLYEKALAMRKRLLGSEDPLVADILHNLGNVHYMRGEYDDAKDCLNSALAIRQKRSPESEDVANTLNSLGAIAFKKGDLAEANRLWERTLAVREKALGPDHPLVAQTLNNLAIVHTYTNDPAGARQLLERAVRVQERVLGPKHADLASGLMNLGDVVFRLGDDKAAKPYYARAVSILEEASPDNPELARFLDRLATVTLRQGDVSGAQRLYERSLALREKVLGPKHHDVAGSLGGLAECARRHGREREAEALYERSLALCRRPDGGYYVGTDYILDGYSALLDTLGQKTRAAEMKALAVKLRQNGP